MGGGAPHAHRVCSPPHVQRRRVQYRRAADPDWTLRAAQAMVRGKLTNCRVLLQRAVRQRTTVASSVPAAVAALSAAVQRVARTTQLSSLLGVEGSATAAYFGAYRTLLDPVWDFRVRARRPPPDPVNALLSLGYTLLTQRMVGAVELAGLDPFQGFLHQTNYNRPSLALDVLEEFRPVLVDSLVLRLCNDGTLTPADFVVDATARYPVTLQAEGKRRFVAAFEERLQTLALHPDGAEQQPGRVPYLRCLALQARRMVRAIEQDGVYEPFVVR